MRRMADAIRHRGPDGEGFAVGERAAIGMRRLSIIDAEGGWQPLWNEDRTIAIVANGEIYNFLELRNDLEARGHRFSSGSDCETIVHLYEDHGEECVHMLRGMFAFAIIDQRSETMLLGRDRMGEKPLLVADQGDATIFCSELSGLVGSGAVPFEIDVGAINLFMHWGFIPEPQSPVAGTRKLPAGSLLRIDLRTGKRSERVYWRMEDAPPVDGDPVELIRNEIRRIGEITMRSDVPIGVGLSAGIDSSAIAVLAKVHASQPVSAFSVGYEGATWQDETRLAQEFAKYLGLPFNKVTLSVDRIVREFPEVCIRRDEPIVDIAGSSMFALMRLARDHDVPVLLSGQGGDELFWGYQWARDAVMASERKARRLRGDAGLLEYLRLAVPPLSLFGIANWLESGAGLGAGFSRWRVDGKNSPSQLVFWDSRWEYRAAARRARSVFGDRLLGSTVSPAFPFTDSRFWEDIPGSVTERLCSTYLRSNGLTQTDRLSMSCSVEGRVPFVDHRLVELVFGLRKSRSDFGLGPKAWLKAAFRDTVPEAVFRRRKRGFSPPWRSWAPALMRAYGADLESGELVTSGLLAPTAPRELRSAFDFLGRPTSLAFESLVLEQWARGFRAKARGLDTRWRGEPDLSGSRRVGVVDKFVR
jgi:asparagine synthase (glutamine-hydrolysing)